MAFKFVVLLACATASVAVASPQRARIGGLGGTFNFDLDLGDKKTTTPVPILRYVDTQNPDGSYTYGYESGDGTYKIETRYPTGEVKGKYGYYDDVGTFREVEYGATPGRGFEPKGEGFVVPPPTIPQPTEATPAFVPTPAPAPAPAPETGRTTVVRRRRPRPQTNANVDFDRRVDLQFRRNQNRQQPVQPAQPAFRPTPAPVFRPTPAPAPARPAFVPQQQNNRFFAPVQPQQPVISLAAQFQGHPAQNVNLQDGSYSIFYSG